LVGFVFRDPRCAFWLVFGAKVSFRHFIANFEVGFEFEVLFSWSSISFWESCKLICFISFDHVVLIGVKYYAFQVYIFWRRPEMLIFLWRPNWWREIFFVKTNQLTEPFFVYLILFCSFCIAKWKLIELRKQTLR